MGRLTHKASITTAVDDIRGPVVQSIVSLTSSLMVKMLTVLVSTISNSQLFLLKNASSFCKCKSYSHFFSKNISNAIFIGQSFNDMLTKDIVSFEQLGPEFFCILHSIQNLTFDVNGMSNRCASSRCDTAFLGILVLL